MIFNAMWFSKSAEDVLKELQVDPSLGLSEEEATARLHLYGPNALQGKKPKSIFRMFLAQLKDWLIYVLFAAVIITIFMGEYVDAVIIVLVIIINAVLGVAQEVKAGKAIEALQKMSSPKALVRRGGEVKEIESGKVVPGDILILDAGRFAAADLRLIESANLQMEESTLTGESVPTEKDAALIHDDPQTPLGDRANSAFMSTLVTSGRGVGVAVGTGMNTEVGRIAEILDAEEETQTPLERRLNELGKILGKLAIGICILIFVISWIQGRDLAEIFLTAVSLAVASIPEGLAAIVSVVLSIGVTSMSRRKAIVRRLPAVETLGSVTVVCSDKTGTLTQNKMAVTARFNLEGEMPIEPGQEHAAGPDMVLLAKTMILCSDATYENGKGTGDPTEIALLTLGDALGINRKELMLSNERVAECAFDSDRKRMSTLVQENGRLTVCAKGALGSLLPVSTHVLVQGKAVPLTDAYKAHYIEAAEKMSRQALRTLAAAYKPVDHVLARSEMEKDLTLVGLVGMIDPPRIEVKSSIEQAKSAGITTVVITGDHKNTAFAIAGDLGIVENIGQVMTGQDIDDCTDEELERKIDAYRVFARVSPEHKVRIVHALKSRGNIVAMTGDGVNDAPSLNAADIGIAMGIAGTDVAKSASDLILADDNFATIVSAIEQGRNIYNNIRKSVLFLLTSNLGEVVTMFASILLGWPVPLLATHLLWINLLTDTLPAVALGMDPGDPDVMNEPPRNPREGFFAHGAGGRAVLGGTFVGAVTILAFWYGFSAQGYSPFARAVPEETTAYARTMAFMTIISCQLLYSLAFRNRTKSIFQVGLFSNKFLIGSVVLGLLLQASVVGIPVMRKAFDLQMLDLCGWIMVLAFGAVPLLLNEGNKIILRALKRRSRKPGTSGSE
jgi:P-type Ca2+ transporter type 2C